MTATLFDPPPPASATESIPLHVFSERAYSEYAQYVILDRALPQLADGLKPVQRRILYAMSELGLAAHAKFKKSARTVGDCFIAGTLVHTATGLVPIENLTTDDRVLLADGSSSAITELFTQPPQPLLTVTLANGLAFTVTPGQLVRVLLADGTIDWQRADQLTAGQNVLALRPHHSPRPSGERGRGEGRNSPTATNSNASPFHSTNESVPPSVLADRRLFMPFISDLMAANGGGDATSDAHIIRSTAPLLLQQLQVMCIDCGIDARRVNDELHIAARPNGEGTGVPVIHPHPSPLPQGRGSEMRGEPTNYRVFTVAAIQPAPAAPTFDIGIADANHEFFIHGCAVHNCLGKYHPHGDSACYEAMVLMAQPFSYRYPLIDGQGNWGSADDPKSFAAMRYTEARLTPYAALLLNELDAHAVNWQPNFDGTLNEPCLLPARLPNVLLNGTTGIAVGMATDIPPHNLREVVAACVLLLHQPDATLDAVLAHLPAPDYPTGAEIITAPAELRRLYATGTGAVRQRARYQLEGSDIVITALPYQVSGNRIMEQIAAQMQAKKLPLVEDLRDESDHTCPTRLVLALRPRADHARLMAHLFATTELEKSYRVNLNVIGLNGQPQVLPLRELLVAWLTYRRTTVERRMTHRLAQVNERLHILAGLLRARQQLDVVLAAVCDADAPLTALMTQLELTESQAEAVLNMRLRQLARLEIAQVRDEQQRLTDEHTQLTRVLNDAAQLTQVVVTELTQDAERYGDARRSPLVERPAAQAFDDTELAPSELLTVVVSMKGWIRAAKGHDVDAAGLTFKAGDELLALARVRSHQQVVLLDSTGRSYSLAAHTLPSARGQGEPLTSRLEPPAGARFIAVLGELPERRYLLASNAGYGFICPLEALIARPRSGKIVVTLTDDAQLLPPLLIPDTEYAQLQLAVASSDGRLLVFPFTQLPELTRGKGNKLITLPAGSGNESPPTVVMVCIVPVGGGLILTAGKRQLTLKAVDLTAYAGERGRRGALLPRGLQRVEAMCVV